MVEYNESHLLDLAIDGDPVAFEMIVRHHNDKIFSFALAITGGNYNDAGDIMQEALIKSFSNIGKFKKNSSFTSWIWRILRNEFFNYKKAAKTRPFISSEDTGADAVDGCIGNDENLIVQDRNRKLLELISFLPMKYKEVITLIDLNEMNYEEASDILCCSVESLRTRIYRARMKLAKIARKHRKDLLF